MHKLSFNFMRADPGWKNLRKTEGTVIDHHLMPYVNQELPETTLMIAWEYLFEEDLPEGIDQELLFLHFFIPWFLYNWIPDEDFGIAQFDPSKTIAQNYLKVCSDKLNSEEKRFIEAINETYYSFYSILEVELGKSLVVKDILLGTTHKIKEQLATKFLKRGDIIFSRILTIDEQSIFVGMAPFILPTEYSIDLIGFRNWLIKGNDNKALNASSLRDELAMELNDYFFEAIRACFNKPLPILVNTDGDLIQLTKSYLELTIDPEEALYRLLPLTLLENPQVFLDEAKRDDTGMIEQIRIPWAKEGNRKHKDWDNTIMGHITIEKGRLLLETNSRERDVKGLRLLQKYLGDAIHFKETLIESVEKALEHAPKKQKMSQEEKDFLQLPEVQQEIERMAKAHWENWFDKPIPVLDHQTPREAAKTAEGREKLEALLLQYERHDQNKNISDHFKADIQYLKTELKLD